MRQILITPTNSYFLVHFFSLSSRSFSLLNVFTSSFLDKLTRIYLHVHDVGKASYSRNLSVMATSSKPVYDRLFLFLCQRHSYKRVLVNWIFTRCIMFQPVSGPPGAHVLEENTPVSGERSPRAGDTFVQDIFAERGAVEMGNSHQIWAAGKWRFKYNENLTHTKITVALIYFRKIILLDHWT